MAVGTFYNSEHVNYVFSWPESFKDIAIGFDSSYPMDSDLSIIGQGYPPFEQVGPGNLVNEN